MKILRIILSLLVCWFLVFITITGLPFIIMCGVFGETETLNAIAERVGEKIKILFVLFVGK